MEETTSRVINMPDDNPAAFDVLLQHVYFGNDHLRPFIRTALTTKENEMVDGVLLPKARPKSADKRLAYEVCLLAEKLGYEELQNFLVDAISTYWRSMGLNMPEAATSMKDWPTHCALARLRIRLIAYAISKAGLDTYITRHGRDADKIHKWIEGRGPVVRGVFCILAEKDKFPSHPCTGDVCKWHVHQKTPKCEEAAGATSE